MSSNASLVSSPSLQSGVNAGVWQHAALRQSVKVGSCAELFVVGHGCDKTNVEENVICFHWFPLKNLSDRFKGSAMEGSA